MTKREFYTAIIENEELNNEMKEVARKALHSLDTQEANRNKKQAEQHAKTRAKILEVLKNGDKLLASEIATILEYETSVISGVLQGMIKKGTVQGEKITIRGGGTKVQYSIVAEEEDEEGEEE